MYKNHYIINLNGTILSEYQSKFFWPKKDTKKNQKKRAAISYSFVLISSIHLLIQLAIQLEFIVSTDSD